MASKHKRKGRSKFIMIEGYVKRSPAWHALTPVERSAYIELKWRYDGANNGRIGLGVRELADELGMGRSTAADALDGLQAKGFLSKEKPSAFHVKNRTATEWRLTEHKCDVTGNLPTKDFMRWEATEKAQSAPPDAQSAPPDTKPQKTPENEASSPLHRTVKPVFGISQSAPPDTYISTIPSSELETGTTGLGEIAQRAIQSAVASKLPGRRSPAQREQSKKFLSTLEERRALARDRDAKRQSDIELMKAAIMGGGK